MGRGASASIGKFVMATSQLGFVVDRRGRPVGFYRGNTFVPRLCGFVGLAGADDLMIGGRQIKHEVTVLGVLALVMGIVARVLFDRSDTVLG